MRTINMLSSADMIKGQGVASAFSEQVNLVSQGLRDEYKVVINSKKRCDILHFHTIDPAFYLTAVKERKKSPTVGYVHFLPDTLDESLKIPSIGRKVFYKYIIEFYDYMDYLVTVNPSFIKNLEEYGISKEKITYIPNYVSENQFFSLDENNIQNLKKAWGIPLDRFIVLGAGQVQTRKGVMDFVETAKLNPDIFFMWAGGFSFGPITDGYKKLKEIMADHPANVSFIGMVDRSIMNEIYNIADAIFLPSYNELFPMTVLEGMCCMKPIILRDLDVYEDILFDYYLKGNSVGEFSNAINLLASDKCKYREWSDKSYQGHNSYSEDSVLKMWRTFYNNVYEEFSGNYGSKSGKIKIKLKK